MAKKIITDINMGDNRVTNLGTPADPSDAVTKAYVDGLVVERPAKFTEKANTPVSLDNTHDWYVRTTGEAVYLPANVTIGQQVRVFNMGLNSVYILSTRSPEGGIPAKLLINTGTLQNLPTQHELFSGYEELFIRESTSRWLVIRNYIQN